jgi:membrane protease YdiL (CAAX protease family)
MPIKFMPTGEKKNEQYLDLFMLIIWAYLYVNLDTVIAAGYFIFLLIYWIMREEGPKRVYPVYQEKKPNIVKDVILGIGIGIAFLYFTAGIFGSLSLGVLADAIKTGLKLEVLAVTSPYVALIVSGPLVAYTEEKFFRGALLPFVTGLVGPNMLVNAVANGSIFALWHLAVYGVTNSMALMVAFVFAFFTTLVIWSKQALAYGIISHALFNSVIVAISYGLMNLAWLGL